MPKMFLISGFILPFLFSSAIWQQTVYHPLKPQLPDTNRRLAQNQNATFVTSQ